MIGLQLCSSRRTSLDSLPLDKILDALKVFGDKRFRPVQLVFVFKTAENTEERIEYACHLLSTMFLNVFYLKNVRLQVIW